MFQEHKMDCIVFTHFICEKFTLKERDYSFAIEPLFYKSKPFDL